ncbi:MAG: hypothetical protein LBP58_11060 [Azoarcus sp.]|nr:hypothetical protein [Azoarcus sp.]
MREMLGIGQVTTLTLLAKCPELGTLSRRKIRTANTHQARITCLPRIRHFTIASRTGTVHHRALFSSFFRDLSCVPPVP